MKPKNCLNNEFSIVLKTTDDINWQPDVINIVTPTTITFAISSQIHETIKKIVWDFGTGNKLKSLTNRKQDLYLFGVECKYKKSHDSTITIQASVYTDTNIFVTTPVISTTINHIIREHYVEPDVFKAQIVEYYKTNNFSNDVAGSIYKIANRLAFASNFINYTYREDMIGDAVVRMIEALTEHKFDPERGNPFSYFTKIAFNAFCNRIKKEKKNRDTLTNYQNEIYSGIRGEGILPYNRGDAMHDPDNTFESNTHDVNDYENEDF